MPPKSRKKIAKPQASPKPRAKASRAGAGAAATATRGPGKPKTASAAPLAEGAPAPDFRVALDDGSSAALADFAGSKLVIFFYPKADTPGCTSEALDFSRLSKAFAAEGTRILGVSADSQKAQAKFRSKHSLAVPLGSDEGLTMLNAFGVWREKSMYGRAYMGVVRSTVLIGSDGSILKFWSNVKVNGHADEVLQEASRRAG